MNCVIVLVMFSVIGSISTVGRDAVHLHCLFSRYVLGLFELNEMNFVLSYYEDDQETFDENHLESYGEVLESHKDVVLAMLAELRRKNSKVYPSDLIMVNLYVNNITGNVHMYSPVKGELIIDKFHLRAGYEVNYKMITKTLSGFLQHSCSRLQFTRFTLNTRYLPLQQLVIDSTELLEKPDVEKIRSHLKAMRSKVDAIFKRAFIKRKTEDFLPTQMLFYDVMSKCRKRSDVESASTSTVDDGLNLMCDVVVISKVSGYTVGDLLDYVLLNFDGDFLKSYQQQVLAATIHPLFTCVHTYVQQFNLDFDNDTSTITRLGEKLLNTITYGFQDLGIYPQNVKTYISQMAGQLKTIVNYANYKDLKTKKPKLLSSVLNLCSLPMKLNGLKFGTRENTNMIVNWSDIGKMIDNFENFVNHLLIEHKNSFLIVKRTIDHSEMFSKAQPLDCFQSIVVGRLYTNDDKRHIDCRQPTEEIQTPDGSTTQFNQYYPLSEVQELKYDHEKTMSILDSCISDIRKNSIERIEYENTSNEIQEVHDYGASSSDFKYNKKSFESNTMSSGEVGRIRYETTNLDNTSNTSKGKQKIDTDSDSGSTVSPKSSYNRDLIIPNLPGKPSAETYSEKLLEDDKITE